MKELKALRHFYMVLLASTQWLFPIPMKLKVVLLHNIEITILVADSSVP